MPSSSPRSATRSTTVCVSCTSSATRRSGWRSLELAEQDRHDDRRRAGRGADRQLARERAGAVGGDLVEHLLLELEQALGTAEEAQSRLGRLHPAAGAVEQLHPEPLLERPHLERDGRLRDAEPLGRLGEAPPLDDRAESGKLARVHKRILSQDHDLACDRSDASGSERRSAAARRDVPTARSSTAHEGLDRHDELAARAVLPAADRGCSRSAVTTSGSPRATSRRRSSCSTPADIAHDVVGPPHGGAGRAGKMRAMGSRLRALRAWARPQRFDLALSHASHELPLAARSLGVPSSYAYDYEFARAQHTLGSRAATRVVVPDVDPAGRGSTGSAPRAAKVRRYPGLKEEYYLSGFSPDRGRAGRARPRSDAASSSSCAPRPRSRSTTATATRSSPTCSSGSATIPACRPSSFPRTPDAARRAPRGRAARRSSSPSTRSTRRA